MAPEIVEGSALSAADHARVYDELLASSLPPAERDDRPDYLAAVADGAYRVTVARAGSGAVVGAAVLEDLPRCGATLLAYLAVDAGLRGGGVGSALVRHVIAVNRSPALLAEVEDPRVHGDTGFGDPARRAEFYRRLGALVLDVPYYQPPIAPGEPPVAGMMLLALALGSAVPAPGDRVPTATVACFVASQSTHDLAPTPERTALRRRLAGDPAVRLLPLSAYLSGWAQS